MTLAAVLCPYCQGHGGLHGDTDGKGLEYRRCFRCLGKGALKVEVEGLEPLRPAEAPSEVKP